MLTYNRDYIDEIKLRAQENYHIIFDALGLPSIGDFGYNNEIRCSCPVHDGDNKTAFSYNIDNGYWACYTNHCHDGCSDIIGLVQKILSKEKETNFDEAITWIKEKLKIELTEEFVEKNALDHIVYETKVANRLHQKTNKKEFKEFPFPTDSIKGKIQPSEYFISQGFSRQVLEKFMIGDCDNPQKPMYMRSFAPVLNSDGDSVIGVTGRIKLEKCPFCYQYHHQGSGCPVDNPKIRVFPKWFHYGFQTNNALYNDWNAEKFVKDSRKIIICESTKNVWWLEQYDIYNSVCIFGLKILPYHLKRILNMGATTLILALDNDENECGQKATQKIQHDLSMYFKIYNLEKFIPVGKDIANLDKNTLTSIKEYVNQL